VKVTQVVHTMSMPAVSRRDVGLGSKKCLLL